MQAVQPLLPAPVGLVQPIPVTRSIRVKGMVVNANAGVYYTGQYWNDLPAVRVHLNQRATGDTGTTWAHHALQLRGRPFEKALFLNCGNGWVEREWLAEGVIKSAVGVDYSDELLAQARTASTGMPIEYHQLDTNTAAFPGEGYDLVVNHAAGHHVARIDKVLRAVCALLPADGWFVSWDYTGPHRNQYGWEQWAAAHRLNNRAPVALRNRLRYPDRSSMVHDDPTEAIHPELFDDVLARYFDVLHDRALGGWLAYLLLTSNDRLFGSPAETVDPWVAEVLRSDADEADAGRTLFRYTIAKPNHHVLGEADRLTEWAAEEEARESAAGQNGGIYYPHRLSADLAAMRRTGLDRSLLEPALYFLVIRRLRGNPKTKTLLDNVVKKVGKNRRIAGRLGGIT
jgi:SAM-dependent methyltransferase